MIFYHSNFISTARQIQAIDCVENIKRDVQSKNSSVSLKNFESNLETVIKMKFAISFLVVAAICAVSLAAPDRSQESNSNESKDSNDSNESRNRRDVSNESDSKDSNESNESRNRRDVSNESPEPQSNENKSSDED